MHTDKRTAFTLFELLAVLTITGIIFMLILGSYNSWSTVQACNGTARILKAGMLQARTLAQARNRYVGFEFGTVVSNNIQQLSGFQIYLCTNETGNTEQLLQGLQVQGTIEEQQNVAYQMGITLAAPYQRLSNHISLFTAPVISAINLQKSEQGTILFFRPDGSVWSGEKDNFHSHYAGVYTRKLFNETPVVRILRIDLATGSIETIKGEYINATPTP